MRLESGGVFSYLGDHYKIIEVVGQDATDGTHAFMVYAVPCTVAWADVSYGYDNPAFAGQRVDALKRYDDGMVKVRRVVEEFIHESDLTWR
jgi:hypothetical protein